MSDAAEREVKVLESGLGDFSVEARRSALRRLKELASKGAARIQPMQPVSNLHAHSFFSYNAYGYSPCRIAWEAYKRGLEVTGIVDFDVLHGVGEILEAGDILGLKTTAGVETRVYIGEFADREINSPGEPGVFYLMGLGFWRLPDPGSDAARILTDMFERARRRNIEMMEKINRRLGEVRIDYERDVLSLVPSNNATERHLLAAYDRKAREVFTDAGDLARFWARALGLSLEESAALLGDTARLHETARARLMKRGGVGYAAPDAESFPRMEAVNAMTLECGAMPTATWLDGTSAGEKDTERFLEFFIDRSIMVLQIIPERNWNIKDPKQKAAKTAKLDEVVRAVRALALPIVVGTEMNKPGQPFADNFETPELSPYAADFARGARFVYGHTVLGRYAGFGAASAAARSLFGADRAARQAFYTEAGSYEPPDGAVRDQLCAAAGEGKPGKLLEIVSRGRSRLTSRF